MATARVRTQTTETVSLQLTMDEAQALTEILAFVGGDPGRGGRVLTDNVLRALKDAGFRYSTMCGVNVERPTTGSIFWKDPE